MEGLFYLLGGIAGVIIGLIWKVEHSEKKKAGKTGPLSPNGVFAYLGALAIGICFIVKGIRHLLA